MIGLEGKNFEMAFRRSARAELKISPGNS